MTAIAIWFNNESQEHPTLWVAADSRISASQTGRVLLEDGAKIFPLQIVCREPGADGFFSNLSYFHSVGFCFAGNTLMGQNAYLSLAPLLSNLISPTGYVPSMADIARYVHTYLQRTFDDYKSRVGKHAIFEAALFGYCHSIKALAIIHFRPQMSDGMCVLGASTKNVMRTGEFQYLGDKNELMTKRLSEALSGVPAPGRPISRMPRYVIQDCIDDESLPSIGGDLQLGIASSFGFQPLALCKPRIVGQPEAFLSYLGRELTTELLHVGEARVGFPALA
ncbi:hypothetical protein [Orrella marina]|uniref:Uncharacterized protein n=1 Tax=Orrella marina TaxID=2163011 RepID=A0A2R4XLP3_9BURK|nr:hypothetical protein [Orrella marina]AWB34717.1 hypothetical protein DBV39_14425 [Orrella marina]